MVAGENIGDNSGIAIAYKAYHIALGGKDAPVLDGYTGDQRFFLSYGQIWREKQREGRAVLVQVAVLGGIGRVEVASVDEMRKRCPEPGDPRRGQAL